MRYIEDYIEDHITREPEYLERLERATNLQRVNGRMCSGRLQGRVLKMFTRMINPRNVLEMGTFTGYSALCIAEGLSPDARLTTIEFEDELEQPIREAFVEAGLADRITLLIGDAVEISRGMRSETYDMIFLDADKREYPQYYNEAKRLLKPGGFILADNTLWDGHVADLENTDRQTVGVRKFNDMAATDPDMETVIIPLRDGISIIRKR